MSQIASGMIEDWFRIDSALIQHWFTDLELVEIDELFTGQWTDYLNGMKFSRGWQFGLHDLIQGNLLNWILDNSAWSDVKSVQKFQEPWETRVHSITNNKLMSEQMCFWRSG